MNEFFIFKFNKKILFIKKNFEWGSKIKKTAQILSSLYLKILGFYTSIFA